MFGASPGTVTAQNPPGKKGGDYSAENRQIMAEFDQIMQ